MDALPLPNDPLGVLASTRRVVDAARHVRIDHERIAAVGAEMATLPGLPELPGWSDDLHFRDGTWRTAGWVLVLDALNFCFWAPGSQSPDPSQRWRVEYGGALYDGYWALVAALRRAVDAGCPLWDPFYLVGLTPGDVAHLLRPYDREAPEIPLFPMRVQNLHELGRELIAAFPDRNPVSEVIERAERSAAQLVAGVARLFPSFNDVALYDGEAVQFYKRAQILVADLHGAFGGEGLGRFDDLDVLTAFADYKVPQVLRGLGVLVYDEALAATIERRSLVPMGSAEEVEIRAATIWACEWLRGALASAGQRMRAFEIDWVLWQAGQALPATTPPYHRTYTVFY